MWRANNIFDVWFIYVYKVQIHRMEFKLMVNVHLIPISFMRRIYIKFAIRSENSTTFIYALTTFRVV